MDTKDHISDKELKSTKQKHRLALGEQPSTAKFEKAGHFTKNIGVSQKINSKRTGKRGRG